MLTTEEKLEHFSQTVFLQAEKQRDEILKKAEVEAKQKTEEFENNCLNIAYKNIQKQLGQIQKSANESISKFQLDSKKELLLKRESIVKEVFEQAMEKLTIFLSSNEYPDYLIDTIKDAIVSLGDGELVIYLDANDKRHLETVKSTFPNKAVELLPAEDKLIGGARVYSKATLQIADMSIANHLKNEKQNFLNNSGLTLS